MQMSISNLSPRTRRALAASALAAAMAVGVTAAGPASARSPDECAQKWAMASRSYLTKNRTQGPEEGEFRAACALESRDKPAARLEAIAVAVRALAKLDVAGCERFLDSYIQAKKPKEICAAANDDAALKKLIGENVAPRREK